MGPNIQWVQSYVTDDKLYCVYLARDENEIRNHAKAAGVPAHPHLARQFDDRSAQRQLTGAGSTTSTRQERRARRKRGVPGPCTVRAAKYRAPATRRSG